MKRLLLIAAALCAYGQEPPAPSPLVLSVPDALLIGMVGKPYSYALKAEGGIPPYTWEITSGALPAGLALDGSGIMGTPTEPGVAAFTLSVTDSQETPATVAKAVTLTVQHIYGPYASPEAVTVCQMDIAQVPPSPAIDEVTRTPRCFVVPQAVSTSMTSFLVTQTEGLDAIGNVKYKYASWWDYVVKFFINGLVLPVLDQFPTPEVAAAKAEAEAAARAVDAAKAAIATSGAQY